MQTTKSKTKPLIIAIICVIAVALAVLGCVLIYNSRALQRAVNDLDIEDETSVIRVMKYGGDREDVLVMLAERYIEAGKCSDAARLLLYTVQYVNNESGYTLAKLKECYTALGTSDAAVSNLSSPVFKLTDYEISTECDGTSYALTDDGIYTEFLGGYAKAKLSGSRTGKISACASGVYYIDLSDFKLKLLSKDGSTVKTVLDAQMTDFVDFESYLYYIDLNGVPHGPNAVALDEDTFAAELRVSDGDVLCTIYDKDYNKIKDITIS